MKLFICEKPKQGRAYASALYAKGGGSNREFIDCGNDTYVTWCIGHLLESFEPQDYGDEWKKWNMASLPMFPRDKWSERVRKDVKKQYKAVESLVKKADEVYIASDADREGEAIVVSLLERMKFKGKRMRVWTGAMDDVTIRKAIAAAKPAEETFVLYKAAETRKKADWVHGMNLTRGMTIANQGFVEGVFSVGRVQTAILSIIVGRDLEIENFKAKDYYDMSCKFTSDSNEFSSSWNMPKSFVDEVEGKCIDKEKIKTIVDKVRGKEGQVTLSEKKRKKEKAPLLHSLNELQSECNKLYGYSLQEVLDIAQSLYENHKATTYPRTDCPYVNEEQFKLVPEVFKAIANSDPSNSEIQDFCSRAKQTQKTQVWNDSKVTAHHAIIPNIAKFNIGALSEKEKKVYDLIRRRYIAQFFPEAESDASKIEIICETETFKLTGSMPVSAGWKEVIGKKSENKELPPLKKGDIVTNANPKLDSKKTKPPARINDASLLDAMINAGKFVENSKYKKLLKESKGIGTEATRAGIVETLFSRNYVKKTGKHIISTDKGRALIQAAPEEAKSVELTAYWESQLEEVATGKLEPDVFLKEQEELLTRIIGEIKEGKCTLKKAVGSLYTCPNCEANLRKFKSKTTGKPFWACGNRDECGSFFQDSRGRPVYPKKVDQGTVEYTCEKCNKGKLVRKLSQKNTNYWQCPLAECRQLYSDEKGMVPKIYIVEKVEQGTETHKCFSCKKADLVRKKGQYGIYWQCPSCKKNVKEDENQKPIAPVSKAKSDYKCPECKEGYFVERKGGKGLFFGCNNFPKCKTTRQEKDGKPEGF